MEFVGHVISKEGIAVNPSKVRPILDWQAPTNVKEIRGFLEMAGYYRRFIEGFSKIAGPMTKLLRKNTPFEWSEKCEESFQELKRRLTTTPILAVPKTGKDYTVYCNASKNGLGCVLMQDRKVIAYMVQANSSHTKSITQHMTLNWQQLCLLSSNGGNFSMEPNVSCTLIIRALNTSLLRRS
jgi:hypothetical protein